MKLLLYCTKQPSYLYDFRNITGMFDCYKVKQTHFDNFILNGKIVAECDFEVEKISKVKDIYDDTYFYDTPTLWYDDLLKKSCLTDGQLYGYLENGTGYAIHIKNLNIFDKPKELQLYSSMREEYRAKEKAPQNMCNVYYDEGTKHYILISIRPEWLCKILNGEKTIEIRKKILKEMMQNA